MKNSTMAAPGQAAGNGTPGYTGMKAGSGSPGFAEMKAGSGLPGFAEMKTGNGTPGFAKMKTGNGTSGYTGMKAGSGSPGFMGMAAGVFVFMLAWFLTLFFACILAWLPGPLTVSAGESGSGSGFLLTASASDSNDSDLPSVFIPVTVVSGGDEEELFLVTLTALDGAPLPEGAVRTESGTEDEDETGGESGTGDEENAADGYGTEEEEDEDGTEEEETEDSSSSLEFILTDTSASVRMTAGTVEFGPITFAETGYYCYTVTLEEGSNAQMTYDEGIYYVEVIVRRDANGEFEDPIVVVARDSRDAKAAAVMFSNLYAGAASSDGSGTEDAGGGTEDTGSTEDADEGTGEEDGAEEDSGEEYTDDEEEGQEIVSSPAGNDPGEGSGDSGAGRTGAGTGDASRLGWFLLLALLSAAGIAFVSSRHYG